MEDGGLKMESRGHAGKCCLRLELEVVSCFVVEWHASACRRSAAAGEMLDCDCIDSSKGSKFGLSEWIHVGYCSHENIHQLLLAVRSSAKRFVPFIFID